MSVKVRVCCPMCGQTEDLVDLPRHIENNHVITFAGLGSQSDFFDGELMLNLDPTKPYSYREAKPSKTVINESYIELVKKMKPGPGCYPIG